MSWQSLLKKVPIGAMGTAFAALSVNQPEFLPIGMILLLVSGLLQWRACKARVLARSVHQ